MFIQVMDFRTSRRDEMASIEEEWRKATEGVRNVRRSVIGNDRNDPDHYVLITFYDDAASAEADSALSATTFAADRQSALLGALPTFLELDVVKDIEY